MSMVSTGALPSREDGAAGHGSDAPARLAPAVAALNLRPPLQLQRLHADDVAALFRVRGEGPAPGCLALLAAGESPELLRRMRHELALQPWLDLPCAARPLGLFQDGATTVLLRHDPGGTVLAQLPGGAMDTDRALRLALDVALALQQLHAAGLVHGDLRPSNILVAEGQGAWLTGFGHASRLGRDAQGAVAAVQRDADLAYLPPEQAGGSGRGADVRGDLYALGVVLHELLTGRRPSGHAASLAEGRHLRGAPRQLMDIVHKLLAGVPAQRYQSAASLVADLRRCARDWSAMGAIQRFALNQRGAAERLLAPGQLYGRARPVQALMEAHARVAAHGGCELVVVSGPAGVGKSSIAQELRRHVAARQGHFAAGKFEQHGRDIPYACLAQAFGDLVSGVLGGDEATLRHWQARLRAALGTHAPLLLGVAPELALLTGAPPPPSAPPPPAEAAVRFQSAVRGLLSAFASDRQPLVLFMDDLQWADAGTLQLLLHVLTHEETRQLLVVGACRANEVDAAHPWPAVLAQVRAAGVRVTDIALDGLGAADVAQLVADSLQVERDQAGPLAALVHARTHGNPFFTLQLLSALAEQGLLRLDERSGRWRWDMARLQAHGHRDDVAGLMNGKLQRLPAAVRGLLEVLSCFGSSVRLDTLARAAALDDEAVALHLSVAQRSGLVELTPGGCRFCHDRIQEAAYALIPEAQRPQRHLDIGWRLCAALDADALRAHLFEVVSQLSHGLALIADEAGRLRAAQLFLDAGRRAQADTAYTAALRYLGDADVLLPADRWENCYALAFPVALARAECEFMVGHMEAAAQRLQALQALAHGVVDLGAVSWLQITLHTAMDRSDLAIRTCVAFLQSAGMSIAAHPSDAEVRREYELLLGRLGSREGIAALLALPLLEDPRQRAVLDVLAAALPPAFFSDENLVCLLLCRMANLSHESGNGDASALAYAYLGMVVGPRFGDYPAAFAFGQLGYELVERTPLTRYRARVYMCFAYHVMPWARPLGESLPLLRRAFDVARESGDVTYAGFSSCTLVTTLISFGEHLAHVQREARERLRYVRGVKFGLVADIITVQLQLLATLRGETPVFGCLDDAMFSEAAFEARLVPNRNLDIATCWYWIRKLQARFFAGRYEEAVAAAERAEPLLWTSAGHFEMVQYHLIGALARAAACDGAAAARREQLRRALDGHLAQLRVWARECPRTFQFRVELLEAEVDRVDGRTLQALQGYERALRSSREGNVPQNQAATLELAARCHLGLGLESSALPLLAEARDHYARWGADAKVRQLEAQYPALRRDAPAGHPPADGTRRAAESTDLAAVLKASQALSGEVGLEPLMRTLMAIALEHAGADRILLVLPRGEQLRVEAEAQARDTGDGPAAVTLRSVAVRPEQLPLAVLHYAMRTRATVLLDDARASGHFALDPYIAAGHCHALLCLPLLRRGELIAILYLENRQAAHVFTPARVAVLKLLASTAAMSLENAALEEKESLLKEVHHRVKNNLQLISSLLSLQAGRSNDPVVAELLLESRNRVRSMALVHENLYRAGNFARIPMPGHLQNLCAQLVRAYGMDARRIATRVAVDDVLLDLDRAVCCGLIVNELVSNALKHAFPGGRGGTIDVALRAGEDGRCEISVADDGTGLPADIDVEQAQTLGLQLVGDLTQQLHGRLHVDNAPGARFRIIFVFQEPKAHER
ncbi:AAA family ATPase [Azohydromonas lata]|uniref:AAA family ATPase n=1 Tax=Azohydromonas lata TaxID=45677 RepID=A0ABU5IB80_9BURK|nr:AAA family ATPase [Azohydromonas lata]MDZ5455925.1 AAA family ATPase [Azohydromonas lata]